MMHINWSVKTCMRLLELRSLKFKDGEENGEEMENNDKGKELSQVIVYEPNQAKTKGRPCGHRLKSMREMQRGRARKCNLCDKREQNHDSRNALLR